MNEAFHSTAIEDDEIVAATQLNKSKTDTHKTKTAHNHPNKENSIVRRTPIVATAEVEKSPTVLTKRMTRTESKRSSDPAARTPERILSPKKDINRILRTPSSSSSSKARIRKSIAKTPRRLFDTWNTSPSTKRSPASPQRAKPSTSFRSKLCLANPSTRLKQSTLKFAKVSSASNLVETCLPNTKNVILSFAIHTYCLALFLSVWFASDQKPIDASWIFFVCVLDNNSQTMKHSMRTHPTGRWVRQRGKLSPTSCTRLT